MGMVKDVEEMLKVLKKLGVKSAEIVGQHAYKVEFFPPEAGELEPGKKHEEKRSALTGLTQSESRDLLNMDE